LLSYLQRPVPIIVRNTPVKTCPLTPRFHSNSLVSLHTLLHSQCVFCDWTDLRSDSSRLTVGASNVLLFVESSFVCSSNFRREVGWTIDYRWEDGRFPVSASCKTISNPVWLSRSETGVHSGIRCWKKARFWISLMSD
jgi:hypothetical protein